MKHLTLYPCHDLSGIALIPAPVQFLSHGAELDNQAGREVLGLDFAALLPLQANEGAFVLSHDDPGVGAADEGAPT
jgi:hypothetical protein